MSCERCCCVGLVALVVVWGDKEIGAWWIGEVVLVIEMCRGVVPADRGGGEFGAEECVWVLVVWARDDAVRAGEAEATEEDAAVGLSGEPGGDTAGYLGVWVVVVKYVEVWMCVDRGWIAFVDVLCELFQWLASVALAVVCMFRCRGSAIRHYVGCGAPAPSTMTDCGCSTDSTAIQGRTALYWHSWIDTPTTDCRIHDNLASFRLGYVPEDAFGTEIQSVANWFNVGFYRGLCRS